VLARVSLRCSSMSGGMPSRTRSGHGWTSSGAIMRRALQRSGRTDRSLWGLRVRDLQKHLYRLYFGGSNTFGDPFVLNPEPPSDIDQYVLQDGYAEFVAELNRAAAWSWWSWEGLLYALLLVLCYPLASVFIEVSAWRCYTPRARCRTLRGAERYCCGVVLIPLLYCCAVELVTATSQRAGVARLHRRDRERPQLLARVGGVCTTGSMAAALCRRHFC
jgi:hypothetical protein